MLYNQLEIYLITLDMRPTLQGNITFRMLVLRTVAFPFLQLIKGMNEFNNNECLKLLKEACEFSEKV